MTENHTPISDIQTNRDQVIVRTSIIGIAANILLAGFKAAVGLISNSIAVILDAVNNLSDALSSVITIAGTKLAGKKPDKKHPLGYGRIEYLSAMVVAGIVLYAGLTSLVESVKKIIHPEAADYSVVSLIIIASAVAVKLVLGRYVKGIGQKVNSGSLIASGSDALFDAILSASVLLSAVIFLTTGLSLEAYVGVVISVFIIRSGIEMMMETLDDILGKRADRDTVKAIKKTICGEEAVSGAYDLILHSYGPEKLIGSVHIAIPDTMTAAELDTLERRIAEDVFQKHGVLLTGIGIYASNTKNDANRQMQTDITHIVMSHDGVLQMHGFSARPEEKIISLDVVLDFSLEDRENTYRMIREEILKAYPGWQLNLSMDIDV